MRLASSIFAAYCLVVTAQAVANDLVVSFHDQSVTESGYGVFALPGEAVEFFINTGPVSPVTLTASLGAVEKLDESSWRWTAPHEQGGSGFLRIVASNGAQRLELSAFVLVPAQEITNGYVGDFRVDDYPRGSPRPDMNTYVSPVGFVKVTKSNRLLRISPHFQIGQFVSKQQGEWPKYVAPGPLLYAKLERLLAAVRRQGFDAATLHVMSGYRTPFYNRAIGNVPYSRHIYGDAADVFVDVDEDGLIDDLNGDGAVDIFDAQTMASWLVVISEESEVAPVAGGLGVYDATRYHGPFIHVDSRGHEARWGLRVD